MVNRNNQEDKEIIENFYTNKKSENIFKSDIPDYQNF